MSLWPRNKPLNQPPHAGRVGAVQVPHQDPVERAALVALNQAREERGLPKSQRVAKRGVL